MGDVVMIAEREHGYPGFGMREPWPLAESTRQAAALLVTRLLRAGTLPEATEDDLAAFSVVKGMFNRIHRQDQSDWFVTAVRLGYPADWRTKSIGYALAACRLAVREGDEEAWKAARERTRLLKVRRSLAVYRGRRALVDVPGSGFAYVMSNREDRDLLAVGVTEAPILQEAARVNAQGEHAPMGVRAAWWVADVAQAREVLSALTERLHREEDGRYEADYRWFRPALDRALADADLSVDPLAYLVRVEAEASTDARKVAA